MLLGFRNQDGASDPAQLCSWDMPMASLVVLPIMGLTYRTHAQGIKLLADLKVLLDALFACSLQWQHTQ
jgi:hypothetical protein